MLLLSNRDNLLFAVFPGATDVDFAVIGGLAVGCAMIMAPLSNYLSKRYNFKVPLTIGVIIYVLSQVFAGLSVKIWQLFLTQGLMFGVGLGLVCWASISIAGRCPYFILFSFSRYLFLQLPWVTNGFPEDELTQRWGVPQ